MSRSRADLDHAVIAAKMRGRAIMGASRATPTVTDRALIELLLRSLQYRDAGYTAGELGDLLWTNRKGRISAVQGGGDYAAQMLLGRMRLAGLVRVQSGAITSVWELTAIGRERAIRARQDWHHDLEKSVK